MGHPCVLLALGTAGVLVASLVGAPRSHAMFQGENGRIVFVASSPAGRDIFSILPDGTQERRLTNTGHVQDPRYDATGRGLAFTRVGRSKNVWIMRADGTHERSVITGAADQSQPSWTPMVNGSPTPATGVAAGRSTSTSSTPARGDSSRSPAAPCDQRGRLPGPPMVNASPSWRAYLARVPSTRRTSMS